MSSNPGMRDEDIAGMSDDDVMNMTFVPTRIASEGEELEQAEEGEDTGAADASAQAADEVVAEPDAAAEDEAAPAEAEDKPEAEPEKKASDVLGAPDEEAEAPLVPEPKKAQEAKPKADAAKTEKPATEADTAAAVAAGSSIDYKAEYEKIMAPFKANGKEIKLQNPDEAMRLMQMGANYTKKLQGLAPQLKILRMLENNGLLDEKKLAFLIDIDKKNPAAIKQAIKDSGLDPMDVDISEDSGYKPGNYQVSDQEMSFSNAVKEVGSEPGGRDLIISIQKNWDKRSKDAIWEDPSILSILTTQRSNGIYAKITAEVERRKTLGYVPSTAPFLETYQKVGQELQQQGLLTIQATPAATAAPAATVSTPAPSQVNEERKVVDQRTGLRKPATSSGVTNDAQARAASPTKAAAPKPGTSTFNPLAMSDEDFEKNADLARRM